MSTYKKEQAYYRHDVLYLFSLLGQVSCLNLLIHSIHHSLHPSIFFFFIAAYSAVSIAGRLEPMPAVLV